MGTHATMRPALLALLLLALTPALAAAAEPGPALTAAPEAELRAAVECSDAPAGSPRDPVLLVHGTFTTPQESWVPGYRKVLPDLGFQACTVDLPGRATTDVQTSSEFVVFAIREVARRSGRRVTVVGHSQGTLQPLWALRFWPDVASLVGEYVGLAGPYQGTQAADMQCSRGSCFEAAWQFRPSSKFLEALFAASPLGGIEASSIATQFDQLVYPQPAASTLEGRPPTLVQDLCPGRTVDHASLLYDAATFALVMDALTHPGPVDAGRVDPAVCAQSTLPGADQAGIAAALPGFTQGLAEAQTAPQANAEPPLRCYVTATCPAGATTGATPGTTPARGSRGLRLTRRCIGDGRLRVDVVGSRAARRSVRSVRIRFGRRPVGRDRRGPRFRVVVGRKAIRRTSARRVRATVQRRGAKTAVPRRSLPRCGVR